MYPRRSWTTLLLLAPLAVVPIALFIASSAAKGRGGDAAGALVVVSPQWQGIRDEMTIGFRAWLAARDGSDVDVQWLDLGGGANVLNWILERFAATPDGIGVDLMYGGGTDPYEDLKRRGLLLRHDPDPAILDGVAHELLGFPIVDRDRRWFGTALTVFGIVVNPRVLDLVPGLRGVSVRGWEDLADPRLAGWVAAADPRTSSSVHTFHEILLQRHGFERGLRLARTIAANARAFSRFSAELPKAVALGQAAAAPSIDHYALAAVAASGGVLEFVVPDEGTLVNADAAAILKGAPHEETARLFVDFLLSDEAARILMLRAGEPGGPRRSALNRAAVRPAIYAEVAGRSDVTIDPFMLRAPFRYDAERANRRWLVLNDLLGALIVDPADELARAVAAWRALAATVGGEAAATARAEALLFENPVSEAQLLEIATEEERAAGAADASRRREDRRLAWARFARERYAAVVALAETAGVPAPEDE